MAFVEFFLAGHGGSQDGSILPARVANYSAQFGSSCQLTELAISWYATNSFRGLGACFVSCQMSNPSDCA